MTKPYTPRKNSMGHRVLAVIEAAPENPWSVSDIAAALDWPADTSTMPIRVALDTLKKHGIMGHRPATWIKL